MLQVVEVRASSKRKPRGLLSPPFTHSFLLFNNRLLLLSFIRIILQVPYSLLGFLLLGLLPLGLLLLGLLLLCFLLLGLLPLGLLPLGLLPLGLLPLDLLPISVN